MGPLLFSQYVNGTHGIPDCLKRVVPLGMILSVFDAFVPLLAAFPAAFFIARRNLPICSLVAHLFQEECGGAESHDSLPLGIGAQGFFVP